jgi:polar amino acid transport system substrate-binding protein
MTTIAMKRIHRILLLGLAVAIAAPAALRAQDIKQQLSSASVVEEVKKRGVLRIGLSTFVPWSMRDKKGELIGFEIDVGNKVAADMGVKVEFVPTAWDGIIPALLAGKFDVIISGMSITPQRNLTANFTIPYAHSGQQMAANKKLAGGFKSLDAFNDPAVTITCRRGTSTCVAAQKVFPKATLRQFDDEAQTLQEVLNGNAHAVVTSAPKPRLWTLDHADTLFMPSEDNLTKSDEAFALRKGDPDAINFFDNWILFNTSNGWIEERHDYWFKSNAWKDQVATN